jgi:hypothetical protein
MKLNHNSLSARLYRWFYITDQMPQTLCPYFWKLVIMWIFIAPVGILSLPLTIIKQEADEWPVRIFGGAILWGMLFLAFLMLFPLTYFIWGWLSPKTTFGAWQGTGILMWGLAVVFSIVWGILELNRRRREKIRHTQREWIWDENGEYTRNPDYVPYEEKPNIIVEFIKAKYNRYCPKIDWKNE